MTACISEVRRDLMPTSSALMKPEAPWEILAEVTKRFKPMQTGGLYCPCMGRFRRHRPYNEISEAKRLSDFLRFEVKAG